MRYIERAAVLLAACVLIGVLVVSRQEAPPVAAEATATPPACSGRDQQAYQAQDRLKLTTRLTPAALLRPAELVTLPWQIQGQVANATLTTIKQPVETTPAGNDFEHYVLTLPRQIQEQVRSRPAANATDC